MKKVYEDWLKLGNMLLGNEKSRAEAILLSWLGLALDSRTEFGFIIRNISQGLGCGDDSGGISLPADIVSEALEEGKTDRSFCVEVSLVEHGGGLDKVERMSVPSFLFYSSVAIVLHAKHVNSDLEPYSTIERVRASCTPEAQFALVSPRNKEAAGLRLEHWQGQI